MCIPAVFAAVGVGAGASSAAAASAAASTAASVANAAILVGTTAASIGINVAANNAEAEAAENQADYEQQVAEYEAELARQQGEVEAIRHGIAARKESGKLRAQMAASGVDLSFGSAKSVLGETARFHAFDQQIIARGVDARVTGIQLRAEQARIEASNIKLASTFANVGAGLRGVAQIGQGLAVMNDNGMLDGLRFDSGRTADKFSSASTLASRLQGVGGFRNRTRISLGR